MKNQTIKLRTTLTLTFFAGALLTQAADHFEHFDINHDGSISFTEYSNKHYQAKYSGDTANCPQGLCDVGFGKHLWKQFAAMDSNNNGAVTRSEFGGTPAPAEKGSAPKQGHKGSAPAAAPAPKGSAPAPAPKGSTPK